MKARLLLDQALHSDQFWWASKNPCWHYQMVERGANLLRETVEALPGDEEKKAQAQGLYQQIVRTGARLYGKDNIAC